MNKGLQLLIAVASLVVIIAGGAYLLDFKRQADDRADREATAALVRKSQNSLWVAQQKAKHQAEHDTCAADLNAYDGGITAAFVVRATANGDKLTGENMLAEVAKCRTLVGSAPKAD